MIYLDNAATSHPKAPAVADTVAGALRDPGNAGRGAHRAATGATEALRQARQRIAGFLGIHDPTCLSFTFNATDALNMAIKGILRPGDHVVISELEHNSVLRPVAGLVRREGVSVTRVAPDSDGFVAPAEVAAAITDDTRLVVTTHASNVLGTVQPVAAMAEQCRERGVPLLVDGAQTAGELAIDVEAMGIDMLAFAGHKSMLGPPGTGGLYVRPGLKLRPWREGGTGSASASDAQPEAMPEHLEAGTQNLPGIVGLAAGVGYLQERGMDTIHAHCSALLEHLLAALRGDARFTVYAARDLSRQVHLLSLNVRDMPPAEVGLILDQAFGIAVRTGLHCAAPAHRCLGTFPGGTVRVSPGPFSTVDDIEALITALTEIADSARA